MISRGDYRILIYLGQQWGEVQAVSLPASDSIISKPVVHFPFTIGGKIVFLLSSESYRRSMSLPKMVWANT